MHWVQDPSQSNVDDLNNIRREASRHFRNKKKAYLKAKIDELKTNCKIKNIRDINDFKKGYQPRTNILKDEKGDLVANAHSILARCWNHFCQLLNVHGVNRGRQTEMNTAEPLAPKPNAFEFELAVAKLKSCCTCIKTIDKWFLFTKVMCKIRKGHSRMKHFFFMVIVCNSVIDIYNCIEPLKDPCLHI